MIDNEWKAVLGWDESETEGLRLSGFAFIREGHYEKALLFFKALVILEALNVYDLQTLGALYLQLNDYEKALRTLDKALRLQGNHLPTLINKTKALFLLNRLDEAMVLAKFLKTCPDVSIANDAEALIISYGPNRIPS